jgi:hypothetical protein
MPILKYSVWTMLGRELSVEILITRKKLQKYRILDDIKAGGIVLLDWSPIENLDVKSNTSAPDLIDRINQINGYLNQKPKTRYEVDENMMGVNWSEDDDLGAFCDELQNFVDISKKDVEIVPVKSVAGNGSHLNFQVSDRQWNAALREYYGMRKYPLRLEELTDRGLTQFEAYVLANVEIGRTISFIAHVKRMSKKRVGETLERAKAKIGYI